MERIDSENLFPPGWKTDLDWYMVMDYMQANKSWFWHHVWYRHCGSKGLFLCCRFHLNLPSRITETRQTEMLTDLHFLVRGKGEKGGGYDETLQRPLILAEYFNKARQYKPKQR